MTISPPDKCGFPEEKLLPLSKPKPKPKPKPKLMIVDQLGYLPPGDRFSG